MTNPTLNGLVLLWSVLLVLGGHPMAAKKTQLEFFIHDIVKARNVTAMKVTKGPPAFGMIRVIDDPLTEGPQHNSRALGRARGMYVQDSLRGVNLLLLFTVVFDAGDHRGSTLSFQGQDDTTLRQREISVVGGTGHFRFATGYALMQTQYYARLNAVLGFNVTVFH